MGVFSGFRRESKHNRKSFELTSILDNSSKDDDKAADDIEPNVMIRDEDDYEVIERDVSRETSEPVDAIPDDSSSEESEQFVPAPIKKYSEKEPVRTVVGTTKVIAILNQKGGVGKSTTSVNLGAALGSFGKQVLLIDLDPQGNTSSGLGIEKNQLDACIYDALLGEVPLTDVISPDVCPGLDIAPATINLAGAEVELVSQMARENRLKEAVGAIRGKYDYVFIDCPPSLGLLTINALVAADKILIPIQCEFYALEGVTKLLDTMKRVQTHLNPSISIFGVLLTMYDGRTTLSRQVADEVRGFFGKTVFETIIPRTVKLSEAPSFGQPINEYDPTGKGAEAYNALAKEVISRG